MTYSAVSVVLNRAKRTAELTVHAPRDPQPSSPEAILEAGDRFWALRAFRELDDALLRLRMNEPEIGTIVVRTEGDPSAVLAVDRTLAEHQSHWLIREITLQMKRTLKRLDLTARSFFAIMACDREITMRRSFCETLWIWRRTNAATILPLPC